jgi:hypothetical protein
MVLYFSRRFLSRDHCRCLLLAICCVEGSSFEERVGVLYMRVRQWVLDMELKDDLSGRVMEYLWHVIFGREAVCCPEERECRCNVYASVEVHEVLCCVFPEKGYIESVM